MIKEFFTTIGLNIDIIDLNTENVEKLQKLKLNKNHISTAIGFLGRIGANPSLFFNIKIEYIDKQSGYYIILDNTDMLCSNEKKNKDIDEVFQNFFSSYRKETSALTESHEKHTQIIRIVKENRKQIINYLCKNKTNSMFTELSLHEETKFSTDIDDKKNYTENNSLNFINTTAFFESFTNNLKNTKEFKKKIFFQQEFMNDLTNNFEHLNINVYYLLFQLLSQFPIRKQLINLEKNKVINLIR